jgi:NAD(P)-dependent dehydrogenase (short-subunit alcohol dehydrogenase family)
VVCAARRADEVERVAADIRAKGGRAVAMPTDVTDNSAVEALAQTAISEFGHLDIWINNAGGSPIQAPLTQLDPSTGSGHHGHVVGQIEQPTGCFVHRFPLVTNKRKLPVVS